MFPIVPETTRVSSGDRNKSKFCFSRCSSSLESTQLSVCSACLSVGQMLFWPSGRSHSDAQRIAPATAATSGRHVPHTPPLFPIFLPRSSFASFNYKHMRTAVQLVAAKPTVYFSLWAQHFGMVGDLCPPKRSLSPGLSIAGQYSRESLARKMWLLGLTTLVLLWKEKYDEDIGLPAFISPSWRSYVTAVSVHWAFVWRWSRTLALA